MSYSLYKVASKLQGKPPVIIEAWICFQTLMLIDKGHLNDIEKAEAKEALNELGWDIQTDLKGVMALRPFVALD